MPDYIKRKDLLDLYEGFNTPKYEKLSVPCPVVYQNVLDVPAADVEKVVRCKECIHLGFKDFFGICEGGPVCGIVRPDDYCSHGLRKKEKDQRE